MTNVLSFDVQVYDPGAPVFIPAGGTVAVEPRDRARSDATKPVTEVEAGPVPAIGTVGEHADAQGRALAGAISEDARIEAAGWVKAA